MKESILNDTSLTIGDWFSNRGTKVFEYPTYIKANLIVKIFLLSLKRKNRESYEDCVNLLQKLLDKVIFFSWLN